MTLPRAGVAVHGRAPAPCSGLSRRGAQALERTGFSGCGAGAYFPCHVWGLPGPRIEICVPSLAGRFLSTVSPGKSSPALFNFVLFFELPRGISSASCPLTPQGFLVGHLPHSFHLLTIREMRPRFLEFCLLLRSPRDDETPSVWGLQFSWLHL